MLGYLKGKPPLVNSILFVLHALQFTRMVISMLSNMTSTIFFSILGTPLKRLGLLTK